MSRKRTYAAIVLIAVFGIGSFAAAPVMGQQAGEPVEEPGTGEQEATEEDEEEEDEEDNSGIIDALSGLTETLQDFTGEWDTTLEDLLIGVLFQPFQVLGQLLIRQVTLVLTNTPSVYPNPAVEEIHREVLLVTYLLSGVGFAGIGLLYMTGPLFGVSYSQVRMLLPRLIAALAFASASLPLLQLTVEFSDALVHAFAPAGLQMSFSEALGLSAGLVLAWVINSMLLLAVVVLFVLRAVYILFVAAASPLFAFAWVFPQTKRYADSFIAGYWTALAMAPLDVLVLRFSFALLDGNGMTGFQSVSNWVLGVASLVLLLWIPYQLYGASQAAVGKAYSISGSVKQRVRKHRRTSQPRLSQDEKQRLDAYRSRKQSGNKFNNYWEDDDDD